MTAETKTKTLTPPPSNKVVGNDKQDHDGPLVSTRASDMAIMRYSGHTLRAILMDLPLFVLLALCGSMAWISHVHEHYLQPQIKVLQWTHNHKRKSYEFTYYTRLCDEKDISTKHGADLFLPTDATPQDALEHQLEHGFTIFKSVLSPTTTLNLRNHIVSRNQNLTATGESLFVMDQQNRYSFTPNMAKEKPFQQALMELTNHPQLKAAVEKILGPDPALLEIAPITNTYGAKNQGWHPDVVTHASSSRYSQAFAPCYSIFVQLQDTTREMGATGACPGTHMCTATELHDLCDQEGIQVVDEELGYWPAGDALLMNMNSWHRGSAHRDPDGVDRVMLILTFTAKPKKVAESRQVSQGGTYHLRWDNWGHTWSDLQKADRAFAQPWATLRSLGLYKPRGASWGIDYITSVSMRMANEDTWFEDEDMQKMLDKYGGRLPYLPSFLQGLVDMENDMTFYKFYLTTFFNIDGFVKVVTTAVLIVYILTFVALSLQRKDHRTQQSSSSMLLSAVHRPIMFCGFIYLVYSLACWRVDSTQWAKDIKGNRLYSGNMDNEEDYILNNPAGVTTVPNRYDVLVDQRLGFTRLGMHKDYVKGHYGNAIWNKLIQGVAPTFATYPDLFRDASARYIVDAIALDNGRFLEQGLGGRWHWSDVKQAVAFTKKELAKSSSPLLHDLLDEIRNAIGSYRFGIYQKAALASKHMVPFLRAFETKVLQAESIEKKVAPMTRPLLRPLETTNASINNSGVAILDWRAAPTVTTTTIAPSIFQPSSSKRSLPTPTTNASIRMWRTPSENRFVPKEPHVGAWISAGHPIEGLVKNRWYFGTVLEARAHGEYLVEYADGEEVLVDEEDIRPYKPYEDTMGEIVEVRMAAEDEGGEETYERCEIIRRDEDTGRYHVILEDGGEFFDDVHIEILRRIDEQDDDEEEEEDDDDDNE